MCYVNVIKMDYYQHLHRYHRNRHSKDKDFDKIYFDRMKDYDKSGNNDHRKRKSPPDRRNFDNRNHRKFDKYVLKNPNERRNGTKKTIANRVINRF